MYYKIIYNDSIIDALDELVCLRYQEKNKRMLLSDRCNAQAILSSDGKEIWHVEGMYNLPVDGYKTVKLIEIDEHEYRQIKIFHGKTMEEVIDGFVESTLNGDTVFLTDSLKRLYGDNKIDESKVIALNTIITNDQVEYVLGN